MGKYFMLVLVFFAVFVLNGGSIMALESNSVSLKELSIKVLDKSYSVKQADAKLRQAVHENKFAHSQLYPKVVFDASASRSDDPVYAFGSYLRQERFSQSNFNIDALNKPSPVDDFNASLSIGVPIYTAGRLSSAISSSKFKLEQAREQVFINKEQLLMNVVELYFAALRDSAIFTAAQTSEKIVQLQTDSAAKLVSSGMSPGAEYYGSLAISRNITAKKIEASSGYESALAQLSMLVGENIITQSLAGNLVDSEYSVDSIDSLTSYATENRHDIVIANLQHKAIKNAYYYEKKSVLPSLQAFAALNADSNDLGYISDHYIFGMQLSMPVWDHSYFSRVNTLNEGLQEASAKISEVRQQSEIDITKAYINYSASIKALSVIQDANIQAQKSVEMMRILYKQGRLPVIDMLKGEDQLLQTQSGVFKAAYNMHISYAMLLYASGQFSIDKVSMISDRIMEVQ